MLSVPSCSLPHSPDAAAGSRKRPYSDLSDGPPSPPTTPPVVLQAPSAPALPDDVLRNVLGWVEPEDHRTIRSISQASRSLNSLAQTACGPAYGAAHRATLTRAMLRSRFNFANPRAQSVLSGFRGLHLFAGRRQSAPISWSKWQDLPQLQLRTVLAALPQVTSLWVGGDNPSQDILSRLLAADFPFERLINLTLGDEWIFRSYLPQLMLLLQGATGLRHLSIPGRLRPDQISWRERYKPHNYAFAAQMAPPDGAPPSVVCFANLPELISFTWQPAFMPPTLLDFSANKHLRHLALARAKLGPEQGKRSQEVAVRWPEQGLRCLHLWQCQFSLGFGQHVAAKVMAQNLVELVLDVERLLEPMDLGAFVALRCLKLLGDHSDLSQVLPPWRAPLVRLIIQGRNQRQFLARLAASTYPSLRYVSLAVPPGGDSVPLPFAAMPNLSHLVFRDHSGRTLRAPRACLSTLDLPADNAIDTLTLEGCAMDATLGAAPLPKLRRLELCSRILPQVLGDLLSRQPAPWPHLEQVRVMAPANGPAAVAALRPVLDRHHIGLQVERAHAPTQGVLDF